MAKNIKKTQEYFDKSPEHTKNAAQEYIMYDEAKKRINQHLHGTVLDIGSGGVINYDTNKAKKVVLLDIATANKERAKGNIFFVKGDVRKIGMKDNSVDIIVMQHLLHHLADDNLSKTLKNLTQAMRESHRVLKKGGKMLIVEGLVPYPFDLLQRLLFPINKHLYQIIFKFPMVLQYSKKKILTELRQAGFKIKICETVPDGDVLPIFGMNVPRRFIPIKHKFIVAEK